MYRRIITLKQNNGSNVEEINNLTENIKKCTSINMYVVTYNQLTFQQVSAFFRSYSGSLHQQAYIKHKWIIKETEF